MNDAVLQSITALASRLVVEAGKQALSAFRGHILSTSLKDDQTLVTKYDTNIESWMRHEILSVFADHSIYGEEYGIEAGDAEYVWYLDPIDGTTNFSMGNPMFGTMIGVTYQDIPVVAAVYQPMTDTLAQATINKGMAIDGLAHAATYVPLDTGTVYVERGRIAGALDRHVDFIACHHASFRGWRRFGTMVGATSSMRFDSFAGLIVFGAPRHDLVAHAMLCMEAGYMVTNFSSKPWTIQESDLLVCHANNQQQLVDLLKEYAS